ncbi:MAG: polysaccharide biosynthesis tyrosine autokinase [Gemmatimonadota bacterium]
MASPLPARQNPASAPIVPFDPNFATGFGGYPPPPSEERLELRVIWAILRRHWFLILLCVGVAGAAGWYLTDRMTPVYEAAASLRIAESESAVPGLEVLKDLRGQGSEVNTEVEVLKSRAFADSVVARLGMRLGVVEPRRVPRSRLIASALIDATADTGQIVIETSGGRTTIAGPHGQTVVAKPGDTVQVGPAKLVLARGIASYPRVVLSLVAPTAATRSFVDQLRVSRPNRDANIITVRFRHSDPEVAAAVPNELLSVFLSQRVGTRRTGARSTVDFLRAQMDTLGIELRSAEESLKVFREGAQVVAIETQAQVSVGKLAELKAERDEVASELQALDSVLVRNLAAGADSNGGSAYRRLLAFPTLLRNQTVSVLLASMTTLENQRATLLTRRTMRDPDVITLTGQINGVEGQIRGLVVSYTDGLRAQVAAYDRTLAQSGSQLSAIPAKEVQLARLMRSTSVLGDLSTLLQTRLKEAEIAQAVEDPSAQVVDKAILPEQPVSPRRAVNLALALLVGLFLSVGAVFARELLDNKVHSREDLQRAASVPVLGVIPHFQPERATTTGRLRRPTAAQIEAQAAGGAVASTSLVAASHPASTVLEAYRALRTSLAFALAERPPKIVVITSPTPGDGKSTSTANLAASLAQQKLKVLVIDADMRRGALHRTLGGVRQPGLSELLTGRAELAAVLQPLSFDGIGRIDMISTGTVPPNPAELLSSHRLTDLLEAVEPLYDTILIDSPPVNNVADALVLAPHADGVLLVARGNKTERGAVKFAMEQLASVRAKVMGTVLNDFDTRRADAYGGYYAGTGYGPVGED